MFPISSDVLQYLSTAPATILVAPDAPKFTILYANPAYHQATLTTPEDIVGLGFLEAFPESPEDPYGDNVEVLLDGLLLCLANKERVELPGKRYDVPVRGTNQFETKYWQASNNPVLDASGRVVYISHVTVEITGAYDLAKKERIAREVSEAKRRDLHSLLMDAPAAIAILEGPELIFEFQNAIHRQIFEGRELLGKTLQDAFPELMDRPVMQQLKDVLITGKGFEQKELQISTSSHKDRSPGNLIWNFVYQPRYNSGSQVDGIIIFGYDVTDQVNSRREVEQSEKRLQAILETMAEGLGIVDRQGQMVYANSMAERLLGIKRQEIMNRRYYDPSWQNLRMDGSLLPMEEHPVWIAMDRGEPVFDQEVGVQPPTGDPFFLSINAAPLKDEAGVVTGAIGTFMDVTQRRKSAQMKDEFISTVSHELKTPLTSVKAYLQMVDRSLEGTGNDRSRGFLHRLGVQVNRLEVLIKDFLDITRIDSGKLELKASEFDMQEMLGDLVKDLQLVNPSHRLVITESEPIEVVSDQNRIIQVLTNLITNAVKYSPGSDEVLIALSREETNLVCSVTDFGIGIADDDRLLVFDRFHQAGHNKGSGLSLGLGLYISREIVEKAGGKIWLESVAGKGSTFSFSLPLTPAA